MKIALSGYERWIEIPVAKAPHILACSYRVLSRWEHDDLSAPYWRWYINDRPGAALILPRRRMPIKPGEVVLIPPHTVLGTALSGKIGHLYVHFTLGMDRAATPGQVFTHRASEAELDLVKRLLEPTETDRSHALEAMACAQTLVNMALTRLPGDYWAERLWDPNITRALQLLARPGAEAKNVELARELGMKPNAFIRKFAQATGHTPQRYRQQLKVERAAAWLREGQLDIEEIATTAGFCDRFHFSRVFKQVMGTSPARYRRSHAQEVDAPQK